MSHRFPCAASLQKNDKFSAYDFVYDSFDNVVFLHEICYDHMTSSAQSIATQIADCALIGCRPLTPHVVVAAAAMAEQTARNNTPLSVALISATQCHIMPCDCVSFFDLVGGL